MGGRQGAPFYDMSGMPPAQHGALMLVAVGGDVVLTVGVVVGTAFCVGAGRFDSPGRVGWAPLFGAGFVAAVGLERAARVLGLWAYTDLMATVLVAGRPVGLSPVAEVTLLPALAVWLASRDPVLGS